MRETTILILNYNGLKHLKDCLSSLYKQTYKDFQTILVDNNSIDGSKEFVRKKYPQIYLIANKKNLGAAGGWHVGSKYIRSLNNKPKYIVTLNNDVRLDPHFLEEGINILKKRKNLWFVAPKMYLYYSKNILNSAGDIFYWHGTAGNIGYGEKDGPKFNKEKEVFGVCTAGTFLRGGVFEKVGLFDIDFFYPLDDVDYFFRMQLQGMRGIYSPKPVMWHKHGATIKEMKEYNFSAYSHRNALYIIIKCYPLNFLIKKSPKIIAYQLKTFLKAVKAGKIIDFCKAYGSFIIHLPKMLKKRSIIQKKRTASDAHLKSVISNKLPK